MLVGIVTSSNYLCGRCREAEDKIEEFIEQSEGLIKYFIMDCEKEKDNQNLKGVCDEGKNLPHITFFEQQGEDLSKQWPKDTGYNGAVSGPHLINFMDQLTFNAVKYIDSSRKHKNWLDDKEKKLKMIYFTEKEDTPLLIKILSVQIREDISLAQIDSDSRIRNKHTKFSGNEGLLFLSYNGVTKQYDEFVFEGDIESHKEIKKFINQYISSSDIRIKQSTIDQTLKMMEVKNMKVQQFVKEKLSEDFWVLLHLQEPGKPHPQFDSFKQEYGAFFQYYQSEITCQKCKSSASKNLGIKNFPALIAYPQGKKDLKEFIIIGEDTNIEELNKKFLTYTKQTERIVRTDDASELNQIYKESLDQEQLPVIWYYDSQDIKQVLFLHTLSYMNKYKKGIRFLRYPDPSDELREKWQSYQRGITGDLPQIFVTLQVTGDTSNRSTGFNGEKKFFDYIVFLDGLLANKFEIKMKQTSVIEVNDQRQWDEECRSGTQSCLIAMLSVHREARFKREMEQFKELKESFPKKKVKWVWMDGYCRDEILKSVGASVSELPTLIYYDNVKGKFKTLGKKWNHKNNEEFVQSIRRKNSVYNDVRDELEMGTRDCKEFNVQQAYLYEAVKNKKREMDREKLKEKNKEFYKNLKVEYDEDEDDDNLDQYGMKRDRHKQQKDDL